MSTTTTLDLREAPAYAPEPRPTVAVAPAPTAPAAPAAPRLPALAPTRVGRFPSRVLARALRRGEALLFPLLLLALWWTAHRAAWVPANILPSPLQVATTFGELFASGELAGHVGVSLARVARGAALGVALGLGLGVLLGFSARAETWIGPLFRIFAQIPSIVLIPLLMMMLGIDDRLKLFIMAKACVIPLALVLAEGIREVPAAYREVAAVFRLGPVARLRRIILPAALPALFTGLRQGLAHVWVSLVAVEVMASADGIGYLMTWGRLIFQLDVVFVCVAVIGVIGFLLDFGVRRAETRLLRWKGGAA